MREGSDSSALAELRFLAMGTQITVTVIGEKSETVEAHAAVAEIRILMAEFGHDFWAWGSGRLASLNRELAQGGVINIPPDMRELFARAWQARLATGGMFEPRIGQLVKLWGFDDIRKPGSQPPDVIAISRLLALLRDAPGYDGSANYGPAPGIAWDFGGIGKGYIVDRTLELLANRGFDNALIDAGGNLAARGSRGDRPWCVGIRDPRSPSGTQRLIAALLIGDESVVTHGDDQRYFEHAGERYAHVLDPATGRPMKGLRSLTIVHADATRADAEGAAIYASGPSRWRSLAERLGFDQVLAVLESGEVLATPALARRLLLHKGVEIGVV